MSITFLDTILAAQDVPTLRSIVDELVEDLPNIIVTLLHWFSLCEEKLKHSSLSTSEDMIVLSDFQSKSISVVEILTSTKGTKSSFRETVSGENPCIKLVFY